MRNGIRMAVCAAALAGGAAMAQPAGTPPVQSTNGAAVDTAGGISGGVGIVTGIPAKQEPNGVVPGSGGNGVIGTGAGTSSGGPSGSSSPGGSSGSSGTSSNSH